MDQLNNSSLPDVIVEQHRLADVLSRVSLMLGELGRACLEVQAIGAELKVEHSSEAIIKAQALDRITQSLECLALFNAELSGLDAIGQALVGPEQFSVVTLDSVRAVLEDRISPAGVTIANDISLFDD